jgi:spore germination cell wall hydrolase CwlJ-like protein
MIDIPHNHIVDTMARTLWAEARSEGRAGMQAVANVIMNRTKKPCWWGHDVVSVCRTPYQFSCWNRGDPNLPKLLKVDGHDPAFVLALQIAEQAVAGKLPDITGGADSYANLSVCNPNWAACSRVTARIGRHTFFCRG